MTYWGWDYAWYRPSNSQLKSNGVQFVCRYLSWLPNDKVIDRAEYQNLLSQGVSVVLNWEYYAEDAIRGANHYADGQVQATEAERQRKALGAPACPIYFSADFDATPSQQTAINSWLDGVASVIGRDRTGVYGSYYVVKRSIEAGKAKWGWQTYAWSGGNIYSGAHIYQYNNGIIGGQVDQNRSLQDNFGQITPSGTVSTGGTDVELSDQVALPQWAIDRWVDLQDGSGKRTVATLLSSGYGQARAAADASAVNSTDIQKLKADHVALKAELDEIKSAQSAPPVLSVDPEVVKAAVRDAIASALSAQQYTVSPKAGA